MLISLITLCHLLHGKKHCGYWFLGSGFNRTDTEWKQGLRSGCQLPPLIQSNRYGMETGLCCLDFGLYADSIEPIRNGNLKGMSMKRPPSDSIEPIRNGNKAVSGYASSGTDSIEPIRNGNRIASRTLFSFPIQSNRYGMETEGHVYKTPSFDSIEPIRNGNVPIRATHARVDDSIEPIRNGNCAVVFDEGIRY